MSQPLNDSLISELHHILSQFDRYVAVFIFIFGVVGNVLNIYVFSQRSFRTNSCAWLFYISSFVNLISILSGIITIMIGGWTTNPANTIDWVCKLRAFLVFSTRTMGPWLIVLATIDRWLLSSISATRRRKSSLKNAQRGGACIIILSLLLYAQQLYCYKANLIDTPLKCYGETSACRYLTDLTFAIVTVVMPVIVMILFGVLTISNVRQSHRRVQALTLHNVASVPNKSSSTTPGTSEVKVKRRADRILLRMLLAQVLVLSMFTLPLSLDKFYSTFAGDNGSETVQAINSFVYDIAILLYFLSNGMPFYIYLFFGGTFFRKSLLDMFTLLKQKIMCA